MSQTNINITIDEDLRREFDEFCNEIGMSMSMAFCGFAKTVLLERKIPYEIETVVPNLETLLAMDEVRQLKKDKNKKTYSSFDEILEELEIELEEEKRLV